MYTAQLGDLISNNSYIFSEELKSVINPSFDGLNNPSQYGRIVENFVKKSNRLPFARQARLVAAGTEFITKKGNKSLIISSEMGTGKTQLAINISQADKFKVNLIMSPPHLVNKWADEIKSVYAPKEHKKLKIVIVKRWEDLVPYTRNLRHDGVKYYFIVSREAAKLSYKKREAAFITQRPIVVEKFLDGQRYRIKQFIDVALCPDCFSQIKEANDFGKIEGIPYKCPECDAVLRDVDKSVGKKMQTRISIAEYIKRNFKKGWLDLLIADEVHEYKGGNTGQGNAFAQIVSKSNKIIGLTGTLLNGYASSIFYILYRMNPHLIKDRLGFSYNQVNKFIDQYGASEFFMQATEVNVEGIVTKKGRMMRAPKERAKISPFLLSALLDMTIFLRLDEIKMEGLGLPDYDESVELVEMEKELKEPYMQYISKIADRVKKRENRFLGNLATDSIAVPDMPFQEHIAQGEIAYKPPFTREEYGYTNKEKRLLEIVKKEINAGRQCLVYIHFSNKGVGNDITEMFKNELPQITTNFLSPNIPAVSRQQWIEDNPSEILVCNPELVKTGLDLLQYPTIIFYETTYNVFTLKQASRRSWRIGQKDNVKVIFMAYENTPQHKALELIGAKVAAANSLEGRLAGDDDLGAMGEEEDDIQLALAKAILNNETSKDIQMSSVKNFGNDRDWDSFEAWYLERVADHTDNDVEVETVNVEAEKSTLFVDQPEFDSKAKENELFVNLAKKLLEIKESGTLYGKADPDEKSVSYAGAGHSFEIDDNYRNGLFKGLSWSIKRDNFGGYSDKALAIEIYRSKMEDKAPFVKIANTSKEIDIDTFEDFVKESSSNADQLAEFIKRYYQSSKTVEKRRDLFDIAEEEIDSDYEPFVPQYGYIKKGRKEVRVELSSVEDTKGVQLSLF